MLRLDRTAAAPATDQDVRCTFESLAVGAVFFDPESGEEWRKTDAHRAEILCGEGGEDTFPSGCMVEMHSAPA